jgi:benzoyl-CoA reductase/2-hydroxyglutaryl-CoA dehydratase subunit BcrC/BadD/HgdB
MESLAIFRDVAASPQKYGQSLGLADKQPLLGFPCSYGPEELILAAGFHPYRLTDNGADKTLADRHLQSYCCSFARGLLAEGLSGNLNFLSGVIFPHTCDSLQRLSDIWRIKTLSMRHADWVLPVKLEGASSEAYFYDIVLRLKKQLEAWAQKTITDDDLAGAIDLMNDIRSCLKKLFSLTASRPGLLAASDRGAVLKAAFVMERKQLRESLNRLLGELENAGGDGNNFSGKRIILTGGSCALPDIFGQVASAGGVIVGDNLCGGERPWMGLVDSTQEPAKALAERYRRRPACPAKYQGLTSRAQGLVDMVYQRQANAVIFLLLKFCDPQAFDFPYLQKFLADKHIPSLILEMEDTRTSSHQLATRIEAFIETL